MNRPTDIPEDVWEEFRACITNNFTTSVPGATVTKRVEFLIRVCRAAMAYGQRRADDATERAAKWCDHNGQHAISEIIRSQK